MQQDCRMTGKRAEAAQTIEADPTTLYDLIADLTQMGRWSPENSGGRWVGGATGPEVGAKFRGSNYKGLRRWSTLAEITTAEPGEHFAFRVTLGPVPISDWSYDFEPDGDGTKVTERWTDLRPGWMDVLSRPVMGIADRPAHNQRNIETTLAALKAAAES
jgi:hypothetical protein